MRFSLNRPTLPLSALVVVTALGAAAAAPAQDTAARAYRVLGAPDAPVEMTVYSDFECPYCRNFALVAVPALVAEFIRSGRVRLRYVFFPLAAIHPNAVAAAKAAHCAGIAGRFWDYHDYLFVRQPEWAGQARPDSLWVDYASSLGLDPDAFAACLASPETHAVVESDLREALGAGATGTPTVVLDGHAIKGFSSYDALRATVLDAIESSTRPPTP
jgi:protein-disulfide isomerase